MSDKVMERRLLVSSEVSDMGFGCDPVLRLVVSVVGVGEDGFLRNLLDSSWPREPMADLVITAQADRSGSSSDAYGWRVEYKQPYAVELLRAEEMVKVLRKVSRGLDKMERELGYCESFGAYVARVGKVLGMSAYGWLADDSPSASGPGFQYSDGRYRWTDAVGMASYVQGLVRDFQAPKVES